MGIIVSMGYIEIIGNMGRGGGKEGGRHRDTGHHGNPEDLDDHGYNKEQDGNDDHWGGGGPPTSRSRPPR